jgi:glycosyltransferase involved in cell wall biosynthesis
MKIAFISFYSGTVNRGIETFVDELSSRLSKKHKVVLYQTGDIKENISYKVVKIPANINWDKKDKTGTLSRKIFVDYWSRTIAAMAIKTLPKIFKEKYDVVVPLNGGWQPAFIRILTWIYGGKMVCVGQSGIGWDDRNNLFCFPNYFVSLSTKAFNWAKGVNPLVKSKYIPNGVDLERFKSSGSKTRLELEPPVVLSVGAFTKQKRLDLVIRAVAKINNISLLMVGGGGDQEKSLNDLGKNLLGKRFKMMQVKHSEMPAVYRSSDIFVLVPESSEAFGIVYVEAMASGLPIVAVDDNQRREIIGTSGVFVKNPENTGELSDAIIKVLDNNWGEKPRKQAEKFDWDEIALRYEKLFKEITK